MREVRTVRTEVRRLNKNDEKERSEKSKNHEKNKSEKS